MKALIDKATSAVITTGEAGGYGGPWGRGIEAGEIVVLDIPDGESLEDCDVTASAITLNVQRKAERLAGQAAKESAREARRNRIKAHGSANTLPQIKALVADIIEELGMA